MLLAVDQVSNVSDVFDDGYTSHVRFFRATCAYEPLWEWTCPRRRIVRHRINQRKKHKKRRHPHPQIAPFS
ncbi:hypothetical protein CU665_25845 [Pseudomonas syringae pv. actinidifoliorum]|nr:hypothetical protein [Pseudomonas syringae pv. actinidifoliorum]NAT26057.1 hypothetical protein [Pseudomonas syringae pv. actinidifoliorum]NAT36803.1 hypothetical protein [Pseudomonas syringae pv. actinidifoliorum]NAT65332.1 hypothetical protein [Pseudomonas syringae pv. actinidifoliorum]